MIYKYVFVFFRAFYRQLKRRNYIFVKGGLYLCMWRVQRLSPYARPCRLNDIGENPIQLWLINEVWNDKLWDWLYHLRIFLIQESMVLK